MLSSKNNPRHFDIPGQEENNKLEFLTMKKIEEVSKINNTAREILVPKCKDCSAIWIDWVRVNTRQKIGKQRRIKED